MHLYNVCFVLSCAFLVYYRLYLPAPPFESICNGIFPCKKVLCLLSSSLVPYCLPHCCHLGAWGLQALHCCAEGPLSYLESKLFYHTTCIQRLVDFFFIQTSLFSAWSWKHTRCATSHKPFCLHIQELKALEASMCPNSKDREELVLQEQLQQQLASEISSLTRRLATLQWSDSMILDRNYAHLSPLASPHVRILLWNRTVTSHLKLY